MKKICSHRIFDLTDNKGLSDYIDYGMVCYSDKSSDGRHKWELVDSKKTKSLCCVNCGTVIITAKFENDKEKQV